MHVDIKAYIRTIPDYPKPGIEFRDITTLLNDPVGFREAVDAMVKVHDAEAIDHIADFMRLSYVDNGHTISASS